jgi:hypothetical protein
MSAATGFHAKYPTEIDHEINCSENLWLAGIYRWGADSFQRRVRTDPAAVFARMHYTRLNNWGQSPCYLFQGRAFNDVFAAHYVPRPTNAEILTPSHPAWVEFEERLGAELMRPDFDFWYGGARVVMQQEISTEYWPLCSAQLVGELGFAIAESLCALRAINCNTDAEIHDRAARVWRCSRGSKSRPAFDADANWHKPTRSTESL